MRRQACFLGGSALFSLKEGWCTQQSEDGRRAELSRGRQMVLPGEGLLPQVLRRVKKRSL